MQCFVCGKDSVGEVCNSCIRLEQSVYNKEYTYKEGLIVKKTEDFKIAISTARANGTAVISTSSSGMNAKIDNFNHYIGGVIGVEACSYNGKPAPGVHIKTKSGMERYLIFPQFTDEGALKAAIDKAKAGMVKASGAAPAGASAFASSSFASSASASAAAVSPEKQERLKKLQLLKDNGILSEAEFQAEKAKMGL